MSESGLFPALPSAAPPTIGLYDAARFRTTPREGTAGAWLLPMFPVRREPRCQPGSVATFVAWLPAGRPAA